MNFGLPPGQWKLVDTESGRWHMNMVLFNGYSLLWGGHWFTYVEESNAFTYQHTPYEDTITYEQGIMTLVSKRNYYNQSVITNTHENVTTYTCNKV